MLPRELLLLLCEDMDIASLVALSQTNQSFQESITDHFFKLLLTREHPFYDLDNSNRQSWRECAIAYLSRKGGSDARDVHFTTKTDDFEKYQWPIYTNEPLPADFYCLGRQPETTEVAGGSLIRPEEDLKLRHTGISFKADFFSLCKEGENVSRHAIRESTLLAASSEIVAGVSPLDNHKPKLISWVLSPEMFVTHMMDSKSGEGILIVKSNKQETTRGSSCTSANVRRSATFDYSHPTFLKPLVVIVRKKVFICRNFNGKVRIMLCGKNHSSYSSRPIPCDRRVQSNRHIMIYDGLVHIFDKPFWESLPTAFHRHIYPTFTLIQDPVHTQYAVMYEGDQRVCYLVDIKNRLKMCLFHISHTTTGHLSYDIGAIVMAGISQGKPRIHVYTKEYAQQKGFGSDLLFSRVMWGFYPSKYPNQLPRRDPDNWDQTMKTIRNIFKRKHNPPEESQ